MKKIFYFLAVVLSTAFASCSKDDSVIEDIELPNALISRVALNEKNCYNLLAAFDVAGVGDPSEGHFYGLYLLDFEVESPEMTDFKKQKVHIGGLKKRGRDYENIQDCLTGITLYDIPDVGIVHIPLNEGVYEGESELVSAVNIESFDTGSYDSKTGQKENANIKIAIILKNASVLEIRYVGVIRSSGMDG